MRRTVLALIAVLLSVTNGGVSAQQQQLQLLGQQLRIVAPECGIHGRPGRLDELRGDTLVLSYGTSTMRCHRSFVTRLDAYRGHNWVEVPLDRLPSSADNPPLLEPGARVRVTAPWTDSYSTTNRVVGVVLAVRGDTILLEPQGHDPFEFDMSSVTRLEIGTRRGFDAKKGLEGAGIGFSVSAGLMLMQLADRSEPGTGFAASAALVAIGTVVGGSVGGGGRNVKTSGLLGALVGALPGAGIAVATCQPDGWFDCDAYALMGATGGVVVGGMLGLLAGAFIPADRWEDVALDGLRVSFAPRHDGFSAGMGLAF